MILMTQETFVPIDDLRYLQIECSNQKCKTVVMLDLTLDVSQKGMNTPEFIVPFQCPACKLDFKLGDGITDLMKVYRTLSNRHTKISFRIR